MMNGSENAMKSLIMHWRFYLTGIYEFPFFFFNKYLNYDTLNFT